MRAPGRTSLFQAVASPPALVGALASGLIAALVAAIFMAWSILSPAASMTFSNLTLPGGQRIVLAQGPVAVGDAERLLVALKAADRDVSGYKILALDSPGGPIIEAFAMVDVMNTERVSTVVRPGASCASACAQVLFLSGNHRTIEGNGRIGLHSCHYAGDESRSMMCNDLIAHNAQAHGSPYGAIMAFMHFTSATDMRWLSAFEADCWGFTKWPAGPGGAARPVPAKACS